MKLKSYHSFKLQSTNLPLVVMDEEQEHPDAEGPFFVVEKLGAALEPYNSSAHLREMFDLFDSLQEHMYWEGVDLAFQEAHLVALGRRASFEKRVV